MADPSEEDPNPPIITYTKGDGYYDEKTTHRDPPINSKRVSIAEAQAKIDSVDVVIAQWELKKVAPQAEIDLYNSLPEPGPE